MYSSFLLNDKVNIKDLYNKNIFLYPILIFANYMKSKLRDVKYPRQQVTITGILSFKRVLIYKNHTNGQNSTCRTEEFQNPTKDPFKNACCPIPFNLFNKIRTINK